MNYYMPTLAPRQERDLRFVIADAGLPNVIDALAAYARHNGDGWQFAEAVATLLVQAATEARK